MFLKNKLSYIESSQFSWTSPEQKTEPLIQNDNFLGQPLETFLYIFLFYRL